MEIKVTSFEMEKAICETGRIEMPYSKRQSVWVAEIKGLHEKWELDRNFLEADEDNGSWKTWEIEEGGIYCICPSTKYREQYFIKCTDGVIQEFTKNQIKELLEQA